MSRRKTAVARVYMEAASKAKPAGVTINGKEYKSYFNTAALHYKIEQPLKLTSLDKFHPAHQCGWRRDHRSGGSCSHGHLARALPRRKNRTALKPEGLL